MGPLSAETVANPPVRIAVAGAGWWATEHHLPALASDPRAEIAAIVEPDPVRRERTATWFGVRRSYADLADLLADAGAERAGPAVDGLIVAVPHAEHYAVARAALDAGWHVLVEKPMTLDAEQAWDLVDRARQRGRHLVVGYPLHFARHVQAARALVATGVLGELQLASGVFASVVAAFLAGQPEVYANDFGYRLTGPQPGTYADPARSGGGQGQTQLTHALAALCRVGGVQVRAVSAVMANYALAVDLVDALTLEFTGGGLGTLAGAGSLLPGDPLRQELYLVGSTGQLRLDLAGGRLEVVGPADLLAGVSLPGRGEPLGAGRVRRSLTVPAADAYPAGAPARYLVSLIRSGLDSDAAYDNPSLDNASLDNPSPGELGAHVVAVLAAAYRSAAQGGIRQDVAVPGARRGDA